MNLLVVGIGIPALLVCLAVLLWLRPRINRQRAVRRFRKDLSHVDLVTVAWSQSLNDDHPLDDLWPPRSRRRRDRHWEGDVPA